MKKIALVTGASRGIGKAAALALARDGWTVHVNYIQSRAAAEAVAAQTGGMAICADVSDGQAVLVNNAGVAVYGLLTDLDPAVWQRLFDVNVTGMYNCCRCAIPPMVHEKAGHIINLASILGTNGASCEVAYSATKGAVVAFTKALAKELGPSGIRVNCVAPGCIDTDMIANLSPEDKAELADSTALCRMGTAEDVGDAIALLASERARFVTGQVLGVDGGLLI
jgi:3-oxoacyl-[acyl-carrier protein] reductase